MLRRVKLVVVAVIMVVLAYTLYECLRFYPRAYHCELNVENIAMAMRMYAADWDECLPDPDHWVDQVGPEYVGNMAVFKCPADKSGARSSYGMNRVLAGLRAYEIANPDDLVSVYETAHPRDNPSGGPEDVADPPRHPGWKYPSPRWYRGNMYGYVSGKLWPNEEWEQPHRTTFEPKLWSPDEVHPRAVRGG